MNQWSIAASLPVLFVGLLLWLGSAWLCYANWQRGGRRRSAAWLEGLRFVLITLLAVTLLRPEFIKQIRRSERPEIAVLYDASSSMRTRDVVVEDAVVSRSDWLEAQRKRDLWKGLESSGNVVFQDFAAPPGIDERGNGKRVGWH